MSSEYFAFMGLGPTELIIILVILVLLFGAKKLPELARSIGTSANELKTSMNGGKTNSKSTDKKTVNVDTSEKS